MSPRHLVLAAASAVLLAGGGCSKIRKTKECGRFIEMVNTSLKNIETQTITKPDAGPKLVAANMRKLSSLYDELASDVDALELETPELRAYAKEYREMAQGAAGAARARAEGIEKRDAEKANDAQTAFRKVTARESVLVSKINGFCSGP